MENPNIQPKESEQTLKAVQTTLTPKRQARQEKRTEKTHTENKPVENTQEAKPSSETERKKAARKATKLKPDKFSLRLIKLIESGANSISALQQKTKVSPAELQSKIAELIQANILVEDANDKNVLWMTVNGFNQFPTKDARQKKEKTAENSYYQNASPEPQPRQLKTFEYQNSFNSQNSLKELLAKKREINVENELKNASKRTESNTIIFEPKAEDEILRYFESREDEIIKLEEMIKQGAPKPGQILPTLKHYGEKLLDLEDLLKRGAPTNSVQTKITTEKENAEKKQQQYTQQAQHDQQIQQKQTPQQQVQQKQMQQLSQIQTVQQLQQQAKEIKTPASKEKAEIIDNAEKCELCKYPFKLSIQDSQMAKFGHCFCGSAYHKDCYEHLLAGEKKCIRCASELKMQLGNESKQALEKIKEMF